MKYPRIIVLGMMIPIFAINAQDAIDADVYEQSQKLNDIGWAYIGINKSEEAIENFSQSISIYDQNPDAFVGRSTAYLHTKQFDLAEKDAQSALALAPKEADIAYLIGNIYFKLERYFDAIDHYSNAMSFNKASEVKIDSADCLYNRGNAYMALEFYKVAVNDFSKAIRERDEFAAAYHNRAVSYRHLEQMNEACQDFLLAKKLGSKKKHDYLEKFCAE